MIIVYPDSFCYEEYRVELEGDLRENGLTKDSLMDYFNGIDDEYINEELK